MNTKTTTREALAKEIIAARPALTATMISNDILAHCVRRAALILADYEVAIRMQHSTLAKAALRRFEAYTEQLGFNPLDAH